MTEEFRTFENREFLSQAAAVLIEESALAAVEERGRFTLVLAGGSTPRRTYELLADDPSMPWAETHLFIGDERFVDPADSESNLRTIRESLLERVSIPAENLHFMDTRLGSPEEAAAAYASMLQNFFGGSPRFDVVMLGMGADGHTASLFPGAPDAVLEAPSGTLAVAAEAPPSYPTRARISLTFEALNAADTVLFLVAGADKAEPLATIRAGARDTLPAGRVRPRERLAWYVDRAAAGA